MKSTMKWIENAVISAIESVMLGLGIIFFWLGLAGVSLGEVHGGILFLGYFILCVAIWLVLMRPYLKKL